MSKYLVTYGMSGYMPNEQLEADSLAEAYELALSIKREFREDPDVSHIYGNIRKDKGYIIEFRSDTRLNWYVEIGPIVE